MKTLEEMKYSIQLHEKSLHFDGLRGTPTFQVWNTLFALCIAPGSTPELVVFMAKHVLMYSRLPLSIRYALETFLKEAGEYDGRTDATTATVDR